MALLGQEHLHEVRGHRQLLQGPGGAKGEPGHRAERSRGRLAAGQVVGPQDPVGDTGYREVGQCPAQVPTRVAQLQPARQDHLQRGTGHHAELAGQCDRAGQWPAGDGDAHAALDDAG